MQKRAKFPEAGSIRERYLLSLQKVGDWLTISDWAKVVAKDNPDLLDSANEQAKNQKQKTTGLREIAARLSSLTSSGALNDFILVDLESKPRRVMFATKDEIAAAQRIEIEEETEELTREDIIREHAEKFSTEERYRLSELEQIIKQLKLHFHLDFELDHASALLNEENPGKHHPDNVQLLLKSHNVRKNKQNWNRFSFEEQVEYLSAVVKVQKIVSSKMSIDLDEKVIDRIVKRLQLVY